MGIFNENLSSYDVILSVLNVVGICYAIYWNFKATNSGIAHLFKSRLTVTILAMIYLVAFIIKLFVDIEIQTWSTSMSGLALLVWYYVWSLPPKHSLEVQRHLVDKLEEEVFRRIGDFEDREGAE